MGACEHAARESQNSETLLHKTPPRQTTPQGSRHRCAFGQKRVRRLRARRWRIEWGETIDQSLACVGREVVSVKIRQHRERVGEHTVVREKCEHRRHRPVARPTHQTLVTRFLGGVGVTTPMHGARRTARRAHWTARGRGRLMAARFFTAGRRPMGRAAIKRHER